MAFYYNDDGDGDDDDGDEVMSDGGDGNDV